MKKEELVGKELSNLYAIAKQVNAYFDESELDFLSGKWKMILNDYVNFSHRNQKQLIQTLRTLNINPGNTKDSIVQEITENLHAIATDNGYSKTVREMGYVMSLNRLLNYHVANIDNLDYLCRDL